MWVTAADNPVLRIEPTTGEVVAAMPLQRYADQYEAVAVGAGAVWVAGEGFGLGGRSGAVWRIDPDTNEVLATEGSLARVFPRSRPAREPSGSSPMAPCFGSTQQANRVVETIPVGTVEGLAVGRGYLWAANHEGSFVLRIDPATNQVTARINVRNACSCSAAAGEGGVSVG